MNVTITAQEVRNLDTTCYIGVAALKDLALISQADEFDQVDNPAGLQRALNKAHAAGAYAYVSKPADKDRPRAYPDVALNVRDRKVLKREVIFEGAGTKLVELTFDLEKILDENLIPRGTKVSRLDGNHRLIYSNGDPTGRTPIELTAPFQIHVGLTRDQETDLFATINHEQKGLNTSHLAVLRSRITPEDVELRDHPERVYARRLATDAVSPWNDRVHMGGPRHRDQFRPITFIALEHGVKRTLGSAYMPEATPDVQYGMVRGFWQAVEAVFPEAFEAPRDYLVAKNIGVQAFSILAKTVIDRCLVAQKVEVGHMIPFLEAAKPAVDWHKDSADVAGMSGNRAALLLSQKMAANLPATADAYVEAAPGVAEGVETSTHPEAA